MPTDPAFIRAVEGLKRDVPELQYAPDRVLALAVRVVLNAIREPDEEVRAAAWRIAHEQDIPLYRAMIDAILIQGEGSQPQQFMPDVPMVVDKVTGRFKLAGKIDTATGEVHYPTGEEG